MDKILFILFIKFGFSQPFFSSLFKQFQQQTFIVFCLLLSFNNALANEDCNNLTEDKNWQQKASGMNGWETWVGNKLTNYSFDLEQSCYCPEPVEVRIVVCEGKVFSVENPKTGEVSNNKKSLLRYRTITAYFELIQELQSRHPDEIRVKLNRYLGYPEEIWINPSYKIGDDETNITISNVVPLSQN